MYRNHATYLHKSFGVTAALELRAINDNYTSDCRYTYVVYNLERQTLNVVEVVTCGSCDYQILVTPSQLRLINVQHHVSLNGRRTSELQLMCAVTASCTTGKLVQD